MSTINILIITIGICIIAALFTGAMYRIKSDKANIALETAKLALSDDGRKVAIQNMQAPQYLSVPDMPNVSLDENLEDRAIKRLMRVSFEDAYKKGFKAGYDTCKRDAIDVLNRSR